MAGLIANQAGQAPQEEMPPEEAPPEEVPAEGGGGDDIDPLPEPGSVKEEQPTPEEQEAFDRVELAAKKTIHDKPEAFQKFVEILQGGADQPAKTLAKAALMVFMIVDEAADGNIPEAVIVRGLEVCLDLIIKLAEDTGTMQVDEAVANRAMQELIVQAGEAFDLDTTNLQRTMDQEDGVDPGPQQGEQGAEQAEEQPAEQAQAPVEEAPAAVAPPQGAM
jgi:hypothetical protein